MNRFYSCSEEMLKTFFREAGLNTDNILKEYRLSKATSIKSQQAVLTEDDLMRVTTSLWEQSPSTAINFIYTLGFNAGIRCETQQFTTKKYKSYPSELVKAFVDFIRFSV